MTQVMDAHIFQTGTLTDAPPWLLHISEVRPRKSHKDCRQVCQGVP